jgi:SNF2 family DNA or RNA helicase
MLIANENGQNIELRFKKFLSPDQFQHYVGKIKSIEGKAFVKTNSESYWTVPLGKKDTLSSLFNNKELEWASAPLADMKPSKVISDDLSYIDELILPPYPFQAIGINYLCDQKRCLLADEMGLGKQLSKKQ